jgi:uncharacterized protein YqfA (UPF0365 family)
MHDMRVLADIEPWNWMLLASFIVIVGFVIFLGVMARYFSLWIQCIFTRADINIWQLMMMSIRRVNPTVIVRSKIMAVHYLAGGNVPNVVRALIAAHRAHIDLDWQTAQAIDLAGRDLLEAVRTSVNPKVIDCPDPKRSAGTLDAVAGDGIRLKSRARVTVRTNLRQLVGGATEETIIARVGQGIVQAIGSTRSYKTVLENPERISQTVLGQGLEAQTAYEIVSIDIADIDVGENIGARLMADQAEADMRVAQAKAEQRRAAARAHEQEEVAHVQENRAKVVAAEAQVPLAIAESFRTGKLGLLDYYELKNVQADTRMRMSIAGNGLSAMEQPSEQNTT